MYPREKQTPKFYGHIIVEISLAMNLVKGFKRKMAVVFAVITLLVIGPFAVYRFLHADYLNAAIDALLIISVVVCAVIFFFKHEIRVPALLSALFFSSFAVTVAYVSGYVFIFWVFPAIFINFFLLGPVFALALSVIAIIAVSPIAMGMEKLVDAWSMLASLFFSSCIAYVFAVLAAKQYKQLQSLAVQDPLTKVGNRRAMDEDLMSCIEDYERMQISASIIELDLDFFKRINDKFGHSAGDHVLIEVANLLRINIRKMDRVFRFGGEEFVVLTRNTSLAEAQMVAEKMRVQIEQQIFSSGLNITASFGCAQLHPGETKDEWFSRADKAVYQAKLLGRNRVVTAQ